LRCRGPGLGPEDGGVLSRQQYKALRYVHGRMLFAADINSGNGNLRRTIMALFKKGLVAWDPIYTERAVLTAAGDQALSHIENRLPIVADYLRAKRRAKAARFPAQHAKWQQEASRLWCSMNEGMRRAAEAEDARVNETATIVQAEAPAQAVATAMQTVAERVAHAEDMSARYLGNYNEAHEAGRTKAAEKWLAKSQYWLDVANKLRGWGS